VKPLVVVVGMTRSGTSLMGQALERLGLHFGSPLIPGDEANPRGYYEHKTLAHNQTLLMHTCYDRRGWSDAGSLLELEGDEAEAKRWKYIVTAANIVEEQGIEAVKAVWWPRIPRAMERIYPPPRVFIHCMREPYEVYRSILRANHREEFDSHEERKKFYRQWTWHNAELFKLNPQLTVWYEDWKEDAEKTMERIAKTLGRETAVHPFLTEPGKA